MADENEMVTIAMWPDDRLRLYGQITDRMEKLGYNPVDYSSLDLGCKLAADWPYADNAQPTLAQLVVMAKKLKMRIVIHNLNLEPLKEQSSGPEDGDAKKG